MCMLDYTGPGFDTGIFGLVLVKLLLSFITIYYFHFTGHLFMSIFIIDMLICAFSIPFLMLVFV